MVWEPLTLSLRVACIATIFSVTIGVAIATLLAWKKTPARDLLDAIFTTPLVLPPTVLGYYLLVTLGRDSALGGIWQDLTGHTIVFTVTGAIVAATVGSLPLVIKSARAGLEGVDPSYPSAARTLGAGPVRTFFTVTLPLARNGLIAGAMLGWARALGDFGITLMVAGDIPGETQTASLRIYSDLQAGREEAALIASVILTVVAVAVLWTANRLLRRTGA